jgi:hypothetical protein
MAFAAIQQQTARFGKNKFIVLRVLYAIYIAMKTVGITIITPPTLKWSNQHESLISQSIMCIFSKCRMCFNIIWKMAAK